MDHWGDPWADDADSKSPTKHEVTSPAPTHTLAPVILNGFLDDAPWGSFEDAAAGVWATSPAIAEPKRAATPETRLTRSNSAVSFGKSNAHVEWGDNKVGEPIAEKDPWGGLGMNWEPKEPEHVVSETSDSATTVQPDDTPEITTTDTDTLNPEDDLSTRPSTSPSEVSHNEAPTESPRTSFEDERASARAAADKEPPTQQEEVKGKEENKSSSLESNPVENDGTSDDFGDFEDESEEIPASQPPGDTVPKFSAEQEQEKGEVEIASTKGSKPKAPTNINRYAVDLDLMSQLFPAPKEVEELEEAPDDPVHSTSNRKAWYRLTRKQTMREYNSGNDDDNYIRVTWANSHIRTEINKIVGRWAHEDRVSGKGPGARASFYWDTAHPAENKTGPTHLRKKSTISVSNPIRPAKQSIQPLSTDVPAAFNWSSPSATHDPWKQDSPGLRSTSSPVTVKHNPIAKAQRREGRAVSVNLTSSTTAQAAHKRTPTASDLLNEIAAPTLPSNPSFEKPTEENPWGNLSSLDTSPPSQPIVNTTTEDDDDWGEMVDSPVVSTPAPAADFSQPSTRNNTLSTPSTTPEKIRSSPAQFQASGTRHASPIVRLKGTVSPTSALFGFDKYVPASVEEGPIGPGMLKPVNRSVQSTPEKQSDLSAPESVAGEHADEGENKSEAQLNGQDNSAVFEASVPKPAPPSPGDDDFSAFESSTTVPICSEPSTSPPPYPPSQPPQASTDSWGDADFSIFESSVPTTSPELPKQHDPSDPWSIFDTPTPEPSAPFTRPPPRAVTPPPLQPLTGATNSAQRRKAEEDEIVQTIIAGLPNLCYMLRR